MQCLTFSTDTLPRERRLPLFRSGATDYLVHAVGDPLDFGVSWRLLVLGELNIVEAQVTPVRYERTPAMIEEDGKDRISILYVLKGEATGSMAGEPVHAAAGDALIWDLTCPFDSTCASNSVCRIVNVPRYLIEEVLPQPRFAGRIAASPALALAFDQIGYFLDDATAIAPEGAAFHARAIRDLLVMAALPACRSTDVGGAVPLFLRVVELIDADLRAEADEVSLAERLTVPVEAVAAVLDRFGGASTLVERRRLLAAYRRLSDRVDMSSVTTIAADCGFASLARFSRRFRQVFGCSPREVRLHGQGTLPNWAGGYHVGSNYGPLIAA